VEVLLGVVDEPRIADLLSRPERQTAGVVLAAVDAEVQVVET
jgi:hypothetical protein